MSKSSSSKHNSLYIILGLILTFPIILICCICFKSMELKKYKHQLHLLDPSWACTTTYDDATVILCDDNQRKLIRILGYDTQKFVTKESLKNFSIQGKVAFAFTCIATFIFLLYNLIYSFSDIRTINLSLKVHHHI